MTVAKEVAQIPRNAKDAQERLESLLFYYAERVCITKPGAARTYFTAIIRSLDEIITQAQLAEDGLRRENPTSGVNRSYS